MKIWVLILSLLALKATAATYYIDFANGSDAYSPSQATSKNTPWKRHPYMKGSTVSGYVHTAGDQFIFKGGVTWDSSCFTLTISSGGASATTPDYYGVDSKWYSGSSWTRPIFSNGGTSSNNFITFGANNVTVDNIEMTDFYWTTSSDVHYVWMSNYTNVVLQNCYLHNWKHGGTSDSLQVVASSAYSPFTWGELQYVIGCTIDGAPNGTNSGMAVKGTGNVINCTIKNMTNGILPVTNNAVVSGNDIGPINASFDPVIHTNAIEDIGVQKLFVVSNNFIHDTSSGTAALFLGGSGNVCKAYNNVLWNIAGNAPIILETRNTPSTFYIHYNTIVPAGTTACITTTSTASFPLLSYRNNHCISGNSSILAGSPKPLVTEQSNNILMSNAAAISAGYSAAGRWAPSSVSQATYNKATVTDFVSRDIMGVDRPQGGVPDVGAYELTQVSPPSNAKLTISTL